uniref:HAT C-terminal dimerisation domain-containing protein n=1 Tax=Anopheles melas TaxID=34690 RepID=A0A182TMC0_9DIPT
MGRNQEHIILLQMEQYKIMQNLMANTQRYSKNLPQAEALNNPKAAAKAELDRYLRADILALDQDPLLWWHKEKNNYPKLYDLVQKRFCIAATAVPCDRMYTKAGRLYREKRSKLGVKNVHEILFIQQNYDNAKLEDL